MQMFSKKNNEKILGHHYCFHGKDLSLKALVKNIWGLQ